MSGMINLTGDQHHYLQSIGDAAVVWAKLNDYHEFAGPYAEVVEDVCRYLAGSAPASHLLQEVLDHRAI